ncbi:MAG: hypothetical protein E7J46_01985 [Streptococcus lutetiensis]|nr:hypothetical protein [Streptococcus lutetiensis]MDU7908441.1 hypothetical protein [Streptococcus lutetiensis]
MKKYFKENQVYTVQEGSELEVQLIADGFEVLELKQEVVEEVVEQEEKPKRTKKSKNEGE